jgi:hypothetical protein
MSGLLQANDWDEERVCLCVTLHCGERLMAKNTHSRMSSPYARLVLLNLWQSPPELFCFQVKHDTLHPDWDASDKATGARVPTECCFTIFRDELDLTAVDRDAEKLELVSIDLWDYNAKNSRGADKFLGRTTSAFEEEKQQKLRLNARSARSRVGVGTATISMRTAPYVRNQQVSGGQQAQIQNALDAELQLAEDELAGTDDKQRAGAGMAPRQGSAGTDNDGRAVAGAQRQLGATGPAGLHLRLPLPTSGLSEALTDGRNKTSGTNNKNDNDDINRVDSSAADLCAKATPRDVRAITAVQRTFRRFYGGGTPRTPAPRASLQSRGGGGASRPTQLAMAMPTAAAVRTYFTYPRDRFEEYIPDVRSPHAPIHSVALVVQLLRGAAPAQYACLRHRMERTDCCCGDQFVRVSFGHC